MRWLYFLRFHGAVWDLLWQNTRKLQYNSSVFFHVFTALFIVSSLKRGGLNHSTPHLQHKRACLFWNVTYLQLCATHIWGATNGAQHEAGWRWRWGGWILRPGSVMSQDPVHINASLNDIFWDHVKEYATLSQQFQYRSHFKYVCTYFKIGVHDSGCLPISDIFYTNLCQLPMPI